MTHIANANLYPAAGVKGAASPARTRPARGPQLPAGLTPKAAGTMARPRPSPVGCTAGLVLVIDLPADREQNPNMRNKAGHALTKE